MNKKRAQAWELNNVVSGKERKAQAWGFDLIAGLTIFTMGVFAFFLFSLNYATQGDSILQELQYEASSVSDSLLSDGQPNGWVVLNFTGNTLDKIGILSDGIVNQTKLNNLYKIGNFSLKDTGNENNYLKTRTIFNIKHNFWIDFNGVVSVNDGAGDLTVSGVGKNMSNVKNLIRVTRVISYEGEIRSINIYTWN